MGVNQSYSNPDLVTGGHHHHNQLVHHNPQRVNKLSRASTFFAANNNMMPTDCNANVKSTAPSTTNTFGLRQRYYHNHNRSANSRRQQASTTSVMIDDDMTDNANVMQRHSAHFLDEFNANSSSDNEQDEEENDDDAAALENYDEEIDEEDDDDDEEEEEDAQDQSNYGFLAASQRYSSHRHHQNHLHDSTPNFIMNQTTKMDKVKKPKKFNKLFKLISSSSQKATTDGSTSKGNHGVENKKNTSSEAVVRVRDPEKVANRKKNNLFAKSLVLISSSTGFGKSRFNLHDKENEFNKSYAQSTTSIHKNNNNNNNNTTKLASKFRQISERIANSSKASGSSSYINNNHHQTAVSSQKHKASHHSCSTSSGCSSGASSSNLSSTRRLSTGTKMSQTMLSSSTNSILSSSMAIQSTVMATNAECSKLCSTPLNQDHSSSYRNNSYLNGLNTAGDESASSNVKYSKSMVMSPAMYSLDKSNSTSLNSSELNDIHLGVTTTKKSTSRAQNRKGDELKSKSMYVENEFMSRHDQEERKMNDDDVEDEYKRVKKLSKMENFKNRLSLKFSKSKSKKSINRELQSSTTASRDSGIFTDLFSHLGSMGNLKGRITNATESLRQSFSVFNLKSSSSHGELVATDVKTTTSRRKTLKECNDAYFADNRPVAIQSEILHHNSVNLKEPNTLNQIAEIVKNGDYHFGCNQVEAMPAPAIVRPSSFKSILKRGASISSATTSSSCGTESAGGGSASSSSKNNNNNYDSQLSQFSSTSSSNSFSNYAGSCNLKRTTTFHSTNAHAAAVAAAVSAQASAHFEINRQMSSSGVVNEETQAPSARVFHPTVIQQQIKQTSSSLIDQSNNANRLITPSSMAANNAAKYSMVSNKSNITGAVSNNGHKHQKIVVQASTNDLLRCLIAYLSKECSHLVRLDVSCESGSVMHDNKLIDDEAKFKISSLDIINWLRAPDRILLLQGWQDVAFMNPVNVVFVYMLVRDSMKPSQLRCAFDLQCMLMSCLYLAFSYMGNEISYPLKPFLIEDDRDVFWQRQLKLMSELSHNMLRINREPRFFTELFYELKSYSAVTDKSIILDNSTWLRSSNPSSSTASHAHVHKSITMNSISKFSSSQNSKPITNVNNTSNSSFNDMTKACSVCMDGSSKQQVTAGKVLPILHEPYTYNVKDTVLGGGPSGSCYFPHTNSGGDFSKPIAYCI